MSNDIEQDRADEEVDVEPFEGDPEEGLDRFLEDGKHDDEPEQPVDDQVLQEDVNEGQALGGQELGPVPPVEDNDA